MNKLIAAVVFLVACGGGNKNEKTIEGKSETGPTVAALDTTLANLEAMRAYVVVKDERADCTAYTPAATAALAQLADSTPAAASTRTSAAPDSVAAWQKAKAPAIEKLIAEVAAPVRSTTGCEALDKDETWRKLARALVAIAQPAAVPPQVTRRREAMAEMSTLGAKIGSKDDCRQFETTMTAKYGDLEAQLKTMSPIDQFIDDMVWEEEDEKGVMADAGFAKLMETCGTM